MSEIRPKPKPPLETYDYMWADQAGTKIDCYKSKENKQTVCRLWQVKEPSAFHDAAVMEATARINAIIARVERSNRDKSRHLSFVQFRNRLMLVWASYGRIGPADDLKTIRKRLKLKR
jgi:hypothetical protein